MNPILIPDWIKDLKASEDLARAKADNAAQQQRIAELTVRDEGPEFVRQLVKELAFNTDSLTEIGLNGSTIANKCETPPPERFWRVEVSFRAAFPRMTYTNLFYAPGDSAIRCHPMEGPAFDLPLCVRPEGGGIGAILESSTTPATAEQAAQFVVQRMVRIIRPKVFVSPHYS
jgi:hypothetical protein